jgi:hypothetical protein
MPGFLIHLREPGFFCRNGLAEITFSQEGGLPPSFCFTLANRIKATQH